MRIQMIVAALTVAAAPVAAQDFYVGGGFDYAKPHSGDDRTAATGFAGVAFGNGAIGYGAEIEFGKTIDDNTDYNTARARLIGSYDFGGFAALASVGATQYDLGAGGKFDGYNFGLGALVPMSDSVAIRGEVIRDMMDDDYPTDVTTTRISVIYNF